MDQGGRPHAGLEMKAVAPRRADLCDSPGRPRKDLPYPWLCNETSVVGRDGFEPPQVNAGRLTVCSPCHLRPSTDIPGRL
jgi:hypothetical protein